MRAISNREEKPKKTAEELVKMLKEEKGIQFSIIKEDEAANYLSDKNNYLRTASYRKNYDKHKSGENIDKYINLEFAYLCEMSTIDMHLRSILLHMCIDVEHALKVKIIKEIEANPDEDGYSIVDDFLNENTYIVKSIEEKSDSIFTGDLIKKYFNLCSVFDNNGNMCTRILSYDCPAWVLVEIIGFRSLVVFIDFYNRRYPKAIEIDKNILNPVRSLRNACAHNNCLLNNMRTQDTKPSSKISDFVKGIPTVKQEERKKKLRSRPLFEIVCLLYVYNKVVSENVKSNGMRQLKDFSDNRLLKHEDFFKDNQIITTSFLFIKNIIDSMQEK